MIRTTTVVGIEALKGTVRWVQSDAGDDVGIASIDQVVCVSLCPGFLALGAALLLLTAWLPGLSGRWEPNHDALVMPPS